MDWTQAFREVTPVEQMDGRSVRHARMPPTPWFNEGRRDQKVAFVFAAPGRSEADWQMPAAGDTGLTLNLLLAFLHRARPTLFPKLERYDYRIVNASSRFHYEGLTPSTTPGKQEIKAPANLDRFKRDLVTMELVLCMGDHAWLACQEAYNIREQPSAPPLDVHGLTYPVIRIGQRVFVKSQHLSAQRLNTCFKTRAIHSQVHELVADRSEPKPWHFAKYRTLIVARAIIAALDLDESRSNKLVEEFAENVAAQTEAIKRGDAKTGNKHADRYSSALKKLRSAGNVGRDALAVLLHHPRPDVRVKAAAFLLRYRTAEAMAVLKAAASGNGVAAIGAIMTLKHWEEGTWALDPE